MDEATRKGALQAQQNEITENVVYLRLAEKADGKNREVLEKLAEDELRHYQFWKSITKQDVLPRKLSVAWYSFLATIFGFVFSLRLMERGEKEAQLAYEKLSHVKGVERLLADEEHHENALVGLLKEERLEYAGSIVLGLNDALVELTGALAGLTFALRDGKLVAIAGLVTGLAASLSMAASAYLSRREDETDMNEGRRPLTSATYTGVAYIITVLILVAPFFIASNIYVALACSLLFAIIIVASYTFYITVAKALPFWRRFLEMLFISLTVAVISFGVGVALRHALGVEV